MLLLCMWDYIQTLRKFFAEFLFQTNTKVICYVNYFMLCRIVYIVTIYSQQKKRRFRRHTQHFISFHEDSNVVIVSYNFCDRKMTSDVIKNWNDCWNYWQKTQLMYKSWQLSNDWFKSIDFQISNEHTFLLN